MYIFLWKDILLFMERHTPFRVMKANTSAGEWLLLPNLTNMPYSKEKDGDLIACTIRQ